MRYGHTVILCWTGTLRQWEEKNTSANVTHKPAQIGWVKCNISAGHISMSSHVYMCVCVCAVCVFSGSGLFSWFLSGLSISVPLYAPFPPSHSFPSWTKAIASTLFCNEKFFFYTWQSFFVDHHKDNKAQRFKMEVKFKVGFLRK